MGMGFAPTWLRQVSLLQQTTLTTDLALLLTGYYYATNDLDGHVRSVSSVVKYLNT